MSVRPILVLGSPALRERCRDVEAVDADVRALIRDLTDTMYAAEGVGLAASQIGVPRRVFVYDVREPESRAGALVNPRIVERRGSVKELEGLDGEGRQVRLEATDLLSRCLQHEIDHLDGILFIDHLSPLKRKMLLAKWAKMDESEKVPVQAL